MDARSTSERIRDLEVRVEALQRFKDFTHAWLDAAGVPHDPDPEHTAATACRINSDALALTLGLGGGAALAPPRLRSRLSLCCSRRLAFVCSSFMWRL